MENLGEKIMSQQVVIKHTDENPTFKQRKCIFAVSMALYNNLEKAKSLSKKPKTRIQASRIIEQLQKVQNKA